MDYNFKHYLVINNEEIEVLEPINFDASNFVVEQDKKKWGRDIYKGNEEISLYFGNEIGEPLEVERVLNNGMILRHKNSGLDLLLQINKELGSEAIVYWKLAYGTEFLLFELDFGTAKTDDLTFIELKVIQNLEQAKIKRREKIKIDAFSDKDLDGNTITPIATQKLFMKAKPITQISEWKTSESSNDVQGIAYRTHDTFIKLGANNANQVVNYGIDNTLSFISERYAINGAEFPTDGLTYTYLEAENDLSNVLVEITNLKAYSRQLRANIGTSTITSANGVMRLYLKYGYDDGYGANLETVILYEKTFTNTASTPIEYLPEEITATIPFINRGMRVWIYIACDITGFTVANTDNNSFYQVDGVMEEMNVKITATSTSIPSVIDAVRYIDLIKQNYKGIGASPVIAPKFDIGGQFYNNFCFNGKLIRQITNEPFYLELTDTLESLEEFCADSQVNEANNYIGQYTDFYPNIDLGGFLINPDKEFNITKNERYLINKFTFGYKKYQKDNDEANTLDAIHTDSEWYVPNNKSQNEKKITLPFARDHYLAEFLRRRATNNTSADIDDDTTFIFDVVELAPNSRESFTAVLKFQQSNDDNTFKLLANESFSWNLLGFNNGNTIKVNGIDYVVIDLTPTLLTLAWSGGNDSGEEVFTIDYPLTNVQYTIRTSEGLTFSENLLNPDVYGNLRYSIKHNMKYWNEYLATAGKFIPSKEITNTYFKANGNCKTQFTTDAQIVGENEPIVISDIAEGKILSQNVIKTTVIGTFDRVKKLLEDLKTINPNNTIGGFIRCQDPNGRIFKGYIQKLDNTWKYEELELTLEERNESDFLDIVFSGGIFTINEVGYSTKTFTEKRYNIFNDFIQFFDENNVFLCNRTKYNQVRLNGVVYDSADELAIAIDLLS